MPAVTTRRWWMLAVLLVGQFMGLVDVFVVNVALPGIGAGLHASGATLQLVVAGYIVSYAMLLIPSARLGSMLGRRRLYLTGAAVFTVASLGCGLAPNGVLLVVLRCVQGAGLALMIPQVMSVIQTQFSGPARAKALSAYGAVLSTGAVAGLVLGGVIVGANLFGLSWRPAFFVNVPIGVLLIVAVPRFMPADPPRSRPRVDLAGFLTATSAVLLIVLPLTLGHEFGWPAWTFVAIAAGCGMAGIFVAVERKSAAPLLNLAVLRSRGLAAGLVTLALMQIAYGGLLFAFTLFLENGLGRSPLWTGLTYLPMSAVFGLVGYHWRRLPTAVQPYVAPVGLVFCAVGYLLLAGSGGVGVSAMASIIALGVGMGLSVSPLLAQSLLRVPVDQAADASGALTTVIQLSQVAGVAVFGTLFLSLHGTVAAFSITSFTLALAAAVGVLAAAALTRSLLR
jgi:MFS family permease